jgi:hypothetical protein
MGLNTRPDLEHLRPIAQGEGEPLYAVLMMTYETTLETRAMVGSGARGLTREAEEDLVHRLAENAVNATTQEVERLSRRIGFRTSFLMALAGLALLAAGYGWGAWNASPGAFLSGVAALNDGSALEAFCRAHPVRRDACALPSVVARR